MTDPVGSGGPRNPAAADAADTTPSDAQGDAGPAAALKLVGGLVVVCAGLFVLLVLALVGMALVHGTESNVVAIATAAFGVIGTVVGAYFGLKIGTDGTQKAMASLNEEAAKAQAFAAHVPPEQAVVAIADAEKLAAARVANRVVAGR